MSDAEIKPRPELTESEIQAYVRQWNKRTVLRPLHEGVESLAYAFDDGRAERVVRVNASADGFEKDKYASDNFTSSEVPIPGIIQIDQKDGVFWCVSEFAGGEPCNIVVGIDDPSDELVASLESVINGIRTTDVSQTKGFGVWTRTGEADFASWRGYLRSAVDEHAAAWSEAGSVLGTERIRTILSKYEEMIAFCPEERALIHGDFLGGNVLVEDDQVSAVLDWKYSMYGDHLYDIGSSSFLSSTLSDALVRSARSKEAIDHLEERLLCYRLHEGMKNIRYALNANRMTWAHVTMQASLNHIQYYDELSHM